jgi:serine/threonine protein kinase
MADIPVIVMASEKALWERFIQLDTLGKGMYGSVYKTYDSDLHRYCAVKVIRDDMRNGLPECFLRDAIALMHLKDVGTVVRLYETFIIPKDGLVGLVMELCDANLNPLCSRQHASRRSWTSEHLRDMMWPLLLCLHHVHQRGLLHRDIKPDNILLLTIPSGKTTVDALPVRLSDFGLARGVGPEPIMKIRNVDQCALDYRAPELYFDGTLYREQIDIWSMGCVLYELITRQTFVQRRPRSGVDGIPAFERMFGYSKGLFTCVEDMERHVSTVVEIRYRLARHLTTINETEREQVMEIVLSMLSLRPSHRPSVAHILRHPFFMGRALPDLSSSTMCSLAGDYMTRYEKVLHPNSRCILLEWVLQILYDISCTGRTYYRAIQIFDTFMHLYQPPTEDAMSINHTNFQLVGSTCAWLAYKLENDYDYYDDDGCRLDYFVDMCDLRYTAHQMRHCELLVFKTVGHTMMSPLYCDVLLMKKGTLPLADYFLRILLVYGQVTLRSMEVSSLIEMVCAAAEETTRQGLRHDDGEGDVVWSILHKQCRPNHHQHPWHKHSLLYKDVCRCRVCDDSGV